jgi:HAD superfamily hydrolase (TIGR01509 family)
MKMKEYMVIFDMDGVLVDSEPLYYEANQNFLRSRGIKLSREEYNEFVGISAPLMWESIKTRFGLKDSVEELVEAENKRLYGVLEDEKLSSIEGIPELLDQIRKKGIYLSLASSSPIKVINFITKQIGVSDYFDFVISGEEVVNGKPHPEIFLTCANRFKITPSRALVIEDSKNGILAAKKAGMKAVGFRNLNSGKIDLSEADLVVDSFSQENREKILALLTGGS